MEWDQLVAAFRAVHAAQKPVQAIHSELEDRWFEWERVIDQQKPPQPKNGPLDTSLSLDAIVAQGSTSQWKAKWAAYEIEKAKWEALRDAENAAIMGDIEDRTDAAEDAAATAFGKVKEYPVTSIAMLAEKVALFHERYEGLFEGHDAEALMADINRLAARGA